MRGDEELVPAAVGVPGIVPVRAVERDEPAHHRRDGQTGRQGSRRHGGRERRRPGRLGVLVASRTLLWWLGHRSSPDLAGTRVCPVPVVAGFAGSAIAAISAQASKGIGSPRWALPPGCVGQVNSGISEDPQSAVAFAAEDVGPAGCRSAATPTSAASRRWTLGDGPITGERGGPMRLAGDPLHTPCRWSTLSLAIRCKGWTCTWAAKRNLGGR